MCVPTGSELTGTVHVTTPVVGFVIFAGIAAPPSTLRLTVPLGFKEPAINAMDEETVAVTDTLWP